MFSAAQIARVKIYRGSVVDAAELAVFAAQTFKETFSVFTRDDDMQAHLVATYGPAQQASELADTSVATILARLDGDGELVAYAQVRQNTPPACVTHVAPIELHRFYADRRAHGTTLASTLMKEVCHAAREFKGQHVWLGSKDNTRGIAFYKKKNFVDVGSTIYMVGPDKQIDRVLVCAVPLIDLDVK